LPGINHNVAGEGAATPSIPGIAGEKIQEIFKHNPAGSAVLKHIFAASLSARLVKLLQEQWWRCASAGTGPFTSAKLVWGDAFRSRVAASESKVSFRQGARRRSVHSALRCSI